MLQDRYFDEFAVGDSFVSATATIAKEESLEFARRYDPQPFHLDEGAGRSSIFGGLAVSGWLTCAITMRLIVECAVLRGPGIIGTGIDDLRWLAPVFPGDALTVEGEVIEMIPDPNGKRRGRMRIRLITIKQDGTRVLSQIANLTAIMRPVV